MCGNQTPPKDNSLELRQLEIEEERRRREEQAAKEKAERELFNSSLNSAFSTALDDASNFFAAEGLDPNDYISDITGAAQSARSRVPMLDSSPGTYFQNLGSQVFDRLQNAERSRAQRGIDSFAREGFATRRIGNDVDDPFLEAILEESFGDADAYARRALDRGVLTQTGYEAALRDLQKQRTGANARLQDIGLAELERGRGSLRNIATTARQNAQNLRLGDNFDVFGYQGDIDKAQADFFAGLAGNLQANAPEDLFNTDGLLGIGGAAQGAQNTAFNPFAGEADEEDDNDEDDEEDAFVAF